METTMMAMELDWSSLWALIAAGVTLGAGGLFVAIRARVQKVQAALEEIADLVVKTTEKSGSLVEYLSKALDDNELSTEETRRIWANIKELGMTIKTGSIQAGNSIRAIFQ